MNKRQPSYRAKLRLIGLTGFHSTHYKNYQSKLVVFHSKSVRSNFQGLLHCDDRKSPWWASCNGPQRDHSRSYTLICELFNSYASFVAFFVIHEIINTIRVLGVLKFYYLSLRQIEYENLQNSNNHFVFFLFILVGLCSRYNFVSFGAWYVYKP